MNTLDELLTITRQRTKEFEYQARVSRTDELRTIYRAKADEAYSIYSILINMKRKLMETPKTKKTYYTPDEVRNMSMNDIRENITAIRESMKRWRDE